MEITYICAVTGTTDVAGEKGPLDTVPNEWVRVTIARQVISPKWVAIQQLKDAITANVLNQIPVAADREAQSVAIRLQVEAQYAALEAQTPKYILEEEVAYLAPLEVDPSIQAALNTVRGALGFEIDNEDDGEPAPSTQKPE